jgi:tRNA dimethylallyltransferase
MTSDQKKPLIVIVGPTAVGKTSVSIKLAQGFDGEIVSADSRLFYRGMDIGTAKPTKEEMQGVPHHLIDVADPDEVWNLAVFQGRAYQAIDQIHNRNRLPFLVGGTGQYVRSIVEGWLIPPQKPDYKIREALTLWADKIGAEAFHERLKAIDPVAADKIDYRNVRRTVRALEVVFKTGKRFSELRQKQSCPYHPIILGIERPRNELYARVDQRIENMLADGLVREVEALLAAGYSPELPTFSAIGYQEIIQYLQSKISLEYAIELIKRNTRVFVRRQANWFKPDDPRITWFSASESLVDQMESTIRRQLNEH